MAYDQTHHVVVLFGGAAGDTLQEDTWTWNGTAWSQRQGLTIHPPARKAAAVAYDEGSGQVLLFGGVGAGGPLNDTWSWDGSGWQQLHPNHSPTKREAAAAAYDPAVHALVLYGGIDAAAATRPLADTWLWDGNDWAQLPAQSNGGGLRPRVAYFSGAGLVERFGDCGDGHDRTVYGFDGGTWIPKTTAGDPPPALCQPSLAGDVQRNLVVLFGGDPGGGVSPAPAGTWSYDGNAWTKASPAQSPPARFGGAMVYDNDHHLVVLFGGIGLNQGQTGPLNDTWTWDGSNWTRHQ